MWIAILNYREPGIIVREVSDTWQNEQCEEYVHEFFSKDTDWMTMEELKIDIQQNDEC